LDWRFATGNVCLMVERTKWCQYIESHSAVLRLLSSRGDVTFALAPPASEQDLIDLLSKLKNPSRDPRLLYSLLYILNPELIAFILGDLSDLIRAASRTTRRTAVVSKTGVRGSVLWQRTSVGRLTGRLNSGSFEVRVSERHQNLPENQLLKLFLVQLQNLTRYLEFELRSGSAAKQVMVLRARVNALLRSEWLRDISTQTVISSLMSNRARRSKHSAYGKVLSFSREYTSVFELPRWAYVLNLIQAGWLEPIRDDDIFELYTLIRLVDILSERLGFSTTSRLGLIMSGREEIVRLDRQEDGASVRIYFDQSPVTIFGVQSAYRALLANYEGFNPTSRRPDISLRFSLPDGHRVLLIECKDTTDDGYTRDSAYKAFAYLSDFAELWSKNQDQAPKVIVVFPTNVIEKTQMIAEIVLVGADDSPRLATVLRASLINGNTLSHQGSATS
jgi:hypothetical protein